MDLKKKNYTFEKVPTRLKEMNTWAKALFSYQTFPRMSDVSQEQRLHNPQHFCFLLLQTKKTIKRNIVLEKHVKFVISQDVEYSSLAGIVDAINKLNGKKKSVTIPNSL